MFSIIDFIPSIATISVVGVLGYLCRKLIVTRLKNAVKHEYDEKLELIKADIIKKQQEFDTLKNSGINTLNHRQSIIFETRIKASETLWKATVLVSGGRHVSEMMYRIKTDVIDKKLKGDEKLPLLFKFIAEQANTDKMSEVNAEYIRPFVSKSAWSYFEAYQSIIWHFIAQATLYEKGLGSELLKTEEMVKVVKTVLPHYSDFIDENGPGVAVLLLDELKDKILIEIDNMLSGTLEDSESLNKAAKILEDVHKLKA